MNRALFTLFLLMSVLTAMAQKTYIVCVGLNVNRDRVDPLPCSRSDMKGIARLYRSYNRSDVVMLLDANATRGQILRVLKQQFAKSTAADEIIFAYSGHGFDGGLSTYNNNEVLFCSEVQQLMLGAKARRKIMYVMACHSGSFARKHRSLGDGRRTYNKNSDVMLFLSSQANEYSWEAGYMENSFFYHYLLNGLKGKADKNGDRLVTARELFNYVAPKVARVSKGRQHPVMWGKFPDDMVLMKYK